MKLSPEQLTKRYKAAWQKKDNWRSLYEQCYQYALPQRNLYDGYWEDGQAGRTKNLQVFDSTAVHGAQRFANRMQSGLFPPDKKWMELFPGTEIPEEANEEVRAGLQVYSDKFFSIIRQTNFDLAMGEFLLDLCVGTGIMLIQKGDDLQPIRFQAIPQYLCALEEGPQGTVENVYRKMRVSVENIKQIWPDAELPDVLVKLLEDKPQEMVNLQESTILNVEKGGYGYYVCYKGEGNAESMLVYRKLKISPWIVGRFSKVSGEVQGRGPIVSALGDILTLNKAVELLLKNASLNISGVYTAVDDGVLNPQTIRIVPGAVIPVASNGGPRGSSLVPLPRAGDLQLTQIVLQDLRMNIKKTLLDDSLPPDNMSARSATEVVERMRELATNLGSSFGRLITEVMVPLVRRSMQIMDEQGLINLPLKINGLEVRVVPVSPLAKAQHLDDIQDVMQWAQIAAGMGPIAQATVKMDAIADYVADKLGIPTDLRTSDSERMEMEQQVQQMLQAQQQAPGDMAQEPLPPQ
tara:strand:+ start:344 stop:1906 length:1563 start_codon:yes stop_codon:yes gene_type:complete